MSATSRRFLRRRRRRRPFGAEARENSGGGGIRRWSNSASRSATCRRGARRPRPVRGRRDRCRQHSTIRANSCSGPVPTPAPHRRLQSPRASRLKRQSNSAQVVCLRRRLFRVTVNNGLRNAAAGVLKLPRAVNIADSRIGICAKIAGQRLARWSRAGRRSAAAPRSAVRDGGQAHRSPLRTIPPPSARGEARCEAQAVCRYRRAEPCRLENAC